jgi:hypothetical protein
MFACVRLRKITILLAAYLVGSQTAETTQKIAPGYASAFAGSSKPGVPIRQAGVQESLAPYDPAQCLALKQFRFQGLDFLFNKFIGGRRPVSWGPISQFTLFAALKCLAQESVRAPNFVHSCCFDRMAASSEQGRQDVLGAPVWMCNVLDKWGERHWAEYGAEVAASLEQAYQSQDDKPVQFSWTTGPPVVIMSGEPEAATDRAPAPQAARVDKGPMRYKVFVLLGYQENQATNSRRTVRRFCPCD